MQSSGTSQKLRESLHKGFGALLGRFLILTFSLHFWWLGFLMHFPFILMYRKIDAFFCCFPFKICLLLFIFSAFRWSFLVKYSMFIVGGSVRGLCLYTISKTLLFLLRCDAFIFSAKKINYFLQAFFFFFIILMHLFKVLPSMLK